PRERLTPRTPAPPAPPPPSRARHVPANTYAVRADAPHERPSTDSGRPHRSAREARRTFRAPPPTAPRGAPPANPFLLTHGRRPRRARDHARATTSAPRSWYRTRCSRAIAPMPNAGPSASRLNAGPQPSHAETRAPSQMVNTVSRNPMEVWSVSAVPTAWDGATSVMSAEYCAESATIAKPQTSAIDTSAQAGRKVSHPITSAHPPLTASDTFVTVSRPRRSAHAPHRTGRSPPMAIAENATVPASVREADALAPAARK